MINNEENDDDEMEELHAKIDYLSGMQDKVMYDMTQILLMFESLIKILDDKGIITKTEYMSKLESMSKLVEAERIHEFEKTKKTMREDFLAWLIKSSKDYGNA